MKKRNWIILGVLALLAATGPWWWHLVPWPWWPMVSGERIQSVTEG